MTVVAAPAVLLAPHNDDAELFACWHLLRYRPRVIVVLRSQLQWDRGTGIHHLRREEETSCAMRVLGCEWDQWPYSDARPDWPEVGARIRLLADLYATCIAPAVEEGGHEQHTRVGELALDAFGAERTIPYLTYRRGYGRSRSERPVAFEPGWPALKREALACYESQIAEPSTRPHFLEPLAEYAP